MSAQKFNKAMGRPVIRTTWNCQSCPILSEDFDTEQVKAHLRNVHKVPGDTIPCTKTLLFHADASSYYLYAHEFTVIGPNDTVIKLLRTQTVPRRK
jgi:hypothetical protein